MVKFAIIGAGSRGLRSYGKWIHDNPQVAQVVSVGDPLDKRHQVARIAGSADSTRSPLIFHSRVTLES
ncbi:MAG: hypothetical protein KAR42_14990 [candidate division Zixibacteria bacterium]|nr:hypothetical protein [candidate division Zixibacteria bacterium]